VASYNLPVNVDIWRMRIANIWVAIPNGADVGITTRPTAAHFCESETVCGYSLHFRTTQLAIVERRHQESGNFLSGACSLELTVLCEFPANSEKYRESLSESYQN
jgi:hypothetical protein